MPVSLYTAEYQALLEKRKRASSFKPILQPLYQIYGWGGRGGGASAQNLTQLLRIVCQASNDLDTYAIIIYTFIEQYSL